MKCWPRRLTLTLLLGATPAAIANSPEGWLQVRAEDGIVVYQRAEADSDTISLRGEATIDASVDDIFALMANNAEAHEWMPLVEGKRDLKAIGPTERIEYTRIGMPWPMADRYFVNQGKAEFLQGGVLRLTVKSVDEDLVSAADKEGLILGVMHRSEFLLTPVGDGRRTHMTLEVNSDPKGSIPKWLVNRAQRSWPIDFFRGLCRQLAKHGKLNGVRVAH